jgi:hypothetical protein
LGAKALAEAVADLEEELRVLVLLEGCRRDDDEGEEDEDAAEENMLGEDEEVEALGGDRLVRERGRRCLRFGN